MQRRTFLRSGIGVLGAAALAHASQRLIAKQDDTQPFFSTTDARWQAAYDKACAILAGNVQVLPRYDKRVLTEGAQYPGVWQECGPQEGLAYRHYRPDVARNNHMMFFAMQRPDGQFPASNRRSEAGFGQIQMVVPIAATAWELARMSGDEELLQTAYTACKLWDAWLEHYRDTRDTGLIEGFCTYDTGMDNSPRWAGMPRQCPNNDARQCPPVPSLPRLCPDLSATVYGGRMALARMADDLGRRDEADLWRERAEAIRHRIVNQLYVPEDGAFYDLDAQNRFVKVRSVVITRVCGEHVVDKPMFIDISRSQIRNPHAFMTPYPFPSVALNDPSFVRPLPHNCWGGASQALTALRAPRWMDHYECTTDLVYLMEKWCEALQRDMSFRQQLDPVTGAFTEGDEPGYSPSALVMLDFTWRLAGIVEDPDELQWNVRPGIAMTRGARFRVKLRGGTAEMCYDSDGATLIFAGRCIAKVRGTARVVTDASGNIKALVGIVSGIQDLELQMPWRIAQPHRVAGNQTVIPPQIETQADQWSTFHCKC